MFPPSGVLLLNAVLTVEAHKANSHAKLGWAMFTDAVLRVLNAKPNRIVFLLWGKFAQKKASFIDKKKHVVLQVSWRLRWGWGWRWRWGWGWRWQMGMEMALVMVMVMV